VATAWRPRLRSFKAKLLLLVAVAVSVPALLTCTILGLQLDTQARALFAKGLAANLETFSLILQDSDRNLFDGVKRAAADNTLQITLDLEMKSQLQQYLEAQLPVLGIAFIGVYDKNFRAIALTRGEADLGQWRLETAKDAAGAPCVAAPNADQQLVSCKDIVYLVSVVSVFKAQEGNLGDGAARSQGLKLLGYLIGGTPLAGPDLITSLRKRQIAHPLIWVGDRLVYANIPAKDLLRPANTDRSAREYVVDRVAYLGVAATTNIGTRTLAYAVMAPLAPLQTALLESLMTVAAIGLLLVIATLIIVGFIAKRLLRPVQQLQEGAVQIGAGMLDHRIVVTTGDELQVLADQFNQMAGQLHTSYAGLEQKVEERTRELRTARDSAEAALERQTATADILKVIASSPTDVQPVLDAVAKAAQRFCGAVDALISLREDDEIIRAAHEGSLTSVLGRIQLDRSSISGRTIIDARTIHIPEIGMLDHDELATTQALAADSGARAAVAAPMLREGVAVGSILLRRAKAGPFTSQQIGLLETFAAQAVIAIENVRLFTELRDSLERLKAAQANLIQSEKMASLGQLTAGIAHEIKNPLNFVNNFAGLSVELLDELKEVAEPVLAGMSKDARAEFGETIEMITSNLDKIAEHGKRADGIVKSMLSHSRGGTGDWQESNINALVEEALNLAYHGARAQDKEFNVTLERDFAPITQPIELVPQDVTRVFLNLFGNGFYATKKRHLGGAVRDHRPTLRVSTRDLGEAVEIKVRDNGTGIPSEVRDKLFQPFFTTKPTGEGTGLGLSISYDIVTQQHGGSIDVESEPGAFTEFTVRLTRRRRAGPARKT
jgi:signal transduction histidine kinase